MRFLSLLYWLERFYVPIGITKLLSLWSCFSFLLMSLYYHLGSYLSILFLIFFVLFLFYFTHSCCISVFFTNYCIYSDYLIYTTRKAPFCRNLNGCLKKAFCKIYVTICGRFCPDEGIVAGYGNRIREKYTAKRDMQIAGMLFQTGSSLWRNALSDICLFAAVWSYQVELFMQQGILIKRQVALNKEWPAS